MSRSGCLTTSARGAQQRRSFMKTFQEQELLRPTGVEIGNRDRRHGECEPSSECRYLAT